MKYKTTRAWARRELARMRVVIDEQRGRLAGVLQTHGNEGFPVLDQSLMVLGQTLDQAAHLASVTREMIDLDVREGQTPLVPELYEIATQGIPVLAELVGPSSEVAEQLAGRIVPGSEGGSDEQS